MRRNNDYLRSLRFSCIMDDQQVDALKKALGISGVYTEECVRNPHNNLWSKRKYPFTWVHPKFN